MKNFILWKVFLQNYVKKSLSFSRDNSGFTLIEALTSLLIGGVILTAALAGFASLRKVLLVGTTETDINQRLGNIFATIGPDIQQTGEGLISDPQIPTILIDQQTIGATTTSEITIRKANLIGSLGLCNNLVQGGNLPVKVIYDPIPIPTTLPPGVPDPPLQGDCQAINIDVNGLPDAVGKWQAARNQEGGSIRAFIFDSSTGDNEVFNYTDEQTLKAGTAITPTQGNPPDEVNLNIGTNTWDNDYNAGTSVIYLLEERTYRVNNNTIELIINEDDPLELIEGIERIDVTAFLQPSAAGPTYACKVIPPTASGDCTPGYPNPADYSWVQIKAIEVEVVAQQPEDSPAIATSNLESEDFSLSQRFFPRNTLNF